MTANVIVLKPSDEDDKGCAIVAIEGKSVKVKIHYRLKDSNEKKWGACLEPNSICTKTGLTHAGWILSGGKGTWAVMKFDDPEIRKRKDYKAIWKPVFFALKLNSNLADPDAGMTLEREDKKGKP